MEVKRKFPHFWSAPPEKVGYTYAPYFLFWMGLIIFMLTLGFPTMFSFLVHFTSFLFSDRARNTKKGKSNLSLASFCVWTQLSLKCEHPNTLRIFLAQKARFFRAQWCTFLISITENCKAFGLRYVFCVVRNFLLVELLVHLRCRWRVE